MLLHQLCKIGRRPLHEPEGWDNGYTMFFEIMQIAFMRIPVQQRKRIPECMQLRNALRPLQKGRTLMVIVPRRTNNADQWTRPVHRRIVPDKWVCINAPCN